MRTLLLPLLLMGCTAPQAEQPDSVPAPAAGAGRVEGTVRVVGSTPMVSVVVQPDQGRAVEVEGPLRDELRRLSGARVALSGRVEASADPMSAGRIAPTGYQIVSVDGEPVVTGTVEGRSGGWTVLRTPAGETVYLGGAADQLQPGQRVWVQGPRSVIVQTYGIIEP